MPTRRRYSWLHYRGMPIGAEYWNTRRRLRLIEAHPARRPSDPQLKIRLIGEVRRSEEVAEPKRAAKRSRKPAQPDLGV